MHTVFIKLGLPVKSKTRKTDYVTRNRHERILETQKSMNYKPLCRSNIFILREEIASVE